MPDGPALALQAALVSALKADAGVTALVGARVYDEPPQNVVFPYVRIGRIDTQPLYMSGCVHSDILFSVLAYSRPVAGRVEAERVRDAMVAALDGAPLSLSGFNLAWCYLVSRPDVDQASDGRTYMAQALFQASLEPA